jgi:hypothetical protein
MLTELQFLNDPNYKIAIELYETILALELALSGFAENAGLEERPMLNGILRIVKGAKAKADILAGDAACPNTERFD